MTQAISKPTANTNMRILFWAAALCVFIGLVWLFKGILLPFILGLSIAYLLDPVVARLGRVEIGKMHIGRRTAVLLILGVFLLTVAIALTLILPVIYRELTQLIRDLPLYMTRLQDIAAPYIGWLGDKIQDGQMQDLQATVTKNIGNALKAGGGVLAGLASGGKAVAHLAYVLVLTPIIAYFTMMEWPRIKGWVDDMIPRRHHEDITRLMRQIDRKIAGFIRGQLIVAFALGLFFAIALSIAGLNFGFLIGLSAGALSIIPMVGSTLGLLSAVIVAWMQEGTLAYTAVIAGIFLTGQFVEGNFLAPKIMGEQVGLHPLWIIFALSAGGAALGIVGMLLAVPVAASVGVVGAYLTGRYKESELYRQ